MAIDPPNDLRSVSALLKIMETLRDPDGGCPWDIEQTFDTIAPYTLEEAYEVADTIERKDLQRSKTSSVTFSFKSSIMRRWHLKQDISRSMTLWSV